MTANDQTPAPPFNSRAEILTAFVCALVGCLLGIAFLLCLLVGLPWVLSWVLL